MEIRATNIILYCARWQECVTFYTTVLKLPVTFSNEWFVEFHLSDAARLSVADETQCSIKSSGGRGVTVSLRVAAVELVHEEMHQAGLEPTPIREIWGARGFYVHDPEGNRLEFWE